MERKIMNDVYCDFFGSSLITEDSSFKTEDEQVLEEDINLNNLFIDEDSLTLLNKIINYMKIYSLKEETNYIPFNVVIESEDEELVKEITNILKFYSKKYNYTVNSNLGNLSLNN